MKRLFLTKTVKIVGFLLTLLILAITGIYASPLIGQHNAILLFVATTGVGIVTNNSPTFTPNFIYFVAATVPSGLRITPQGDSLTVDLDGPGLTAFASIRQFSSGPANSYMIPIADGKMPAQGIDIVFTNSAAQTPSVYGISQGKGANHFMSIRQTILANSGTYIDKFSFLSLPSLGATDYISVVWKDGLSENFGRDELAGMLPLTQNSASNYSIDNMAQQIQSVTVYAAAQQIAYILRVRPSLKPAI